MGSRTGLSRQILIATSGITVIAGLVVFFGTYAAYTAIVALYPAPDDDSLFTAADLLIVGSLIGITLPIAAFVSFRLARRILEPLESLALAARRITAGDLTARARDADRALGETAALVDDFNTMAQRLQDMAADMALWNATIAHELRTPLTILKGRLRGMIDGVFEPDERSLEALVLQLDGLSRLVEDLRTVTLADSGHLELTIERLQLAREVARVADLMRDGLVANGFHLVLDLADITLYTDAHRVRQALLALLTNAERHATRGTITLTLALRDDAVVIGVADQGPGLLPDMMSRIFEPFVRGDPTRTRTLGGNGLGLSVVRAIMEAHGGRLDVRSAPGGGALFEMVFLKAQNSHGES